MPALLPLALLLKPAAVWAGAAFAGMGGVGVGMPDSSGSLSDNPASLAGITREEGLVHLGAAWQRLAFAGSAYNEKVTTLSYFPVVRGVEWSILTPTLGSGRFGFSLRQLDRRTLELDEPLDLSLAHTVAGPALSAKYFEGVARLRQDEALNALGVDWIRSLSGGDQQFSLGVAYLDQSGSGLVEVSAVKDLDGMTESLHRVAVRRSMRGFAVRAGYFYRPLPLGSVGMSLQFHGKLRGNIWEQVDGAPLYRDQLSRPALLRVGLGGSFAITPNLVAAVDVNYMGEMLTVSDQAGKGHVLFSGTPAERYATEFSESTISIRAGVEYRLLMSRFELPIRVGFFNEPDSLPAQGGGLGNSAVTQFRPAVFKQDVTGFSLGSGWERGGLRADLALLWMQVNTHVKRQGPAGQLVDSGDVRSSYGAVLSLTLKFSRHRTDTGPG